MYQGRRCYCPHQCSVGWKRRGAPIWLVEVDVKSPCPVGEDPLLRDETVMAAPPPTLMRNVHGALIRTTWLVVMIGDGVVLRLPVVVVRQERQLTFKMDLMSHLSFHEAPQRVIRFEEDLICIHLFVFGGLHQTNFSCLITSKCHLHPHSERKNK